MKKIRFGSFPLTEIHKNDRRCLDKYLIKNFSDNISISDAMRNLNITKDLMYITPDSLMRDWLGAGRSGQTPRNTPDRAGQDKYEVILKRAFVILKDFYKNVSNKPFYKEYVYYPIYIEKIERLDIHHDRNTQLNYSFIVLANDLDKELKVDELRYDSNSSLNFLYLFSEFFADPNPRQQDSKSSKTLNDLKEEDLNFLVKFYQFVEKADKEPIQMVTDIYKFISVIRKLVTSNTADEKKVNEAINKYFKGTSINDFKKYQGIMKHAFMQHVNNGTSIQDYDGFRKAFIDMMNALFNEKGFIDLVNSVDNSDLGIRQRTVYNSNKYQEIINLAKELVKYNNIPASKIVENDKLDFDFNLEMGGYSIELQSQQVSQNYQTYFKDFVSKLKLYVNDSLTEALKSEINTIKDATNIDGSISNTIKDREKSVRELKTVNDKIIQLTPEFEKLENIINNDPNFDTTIPGDMHLIDRRNKLNNQLIVLNREAMQHQADISAFTNSLNVYKHMEGSISGIVKTMGNSTTKLAIDEIINSLSTDLTYLYDDLKELFISETLVAQILENPVNSTTEFDAIYNSNDEKIETLKEFIHTVQADIDTIAESLFFNFRSTLLTFENTVYGITDTKLGNDIVSSEDQNAFAKAVTNHLKSSFDDSSKQEQYQKIFGHEIKQRVIFSVFRNIQRVFSKKKYKQEISQDRKISELHPLIKRMLKEPHNFKAFIIDYDTLDQLYNLWFISATNKFMAGIRGRMPQKLSNPRNRLEFVIEDILGLYNNPVWIIGKTKLYLSMPDYLSLTKTKILSAIDKADLKNICRIDYKDYWDEKRMGQMLKISSGKTKHAQQELDNSQKELKQHLSEKPDYTQKNGQQHYDARTRRLEKAVKIAEEKLLKAQKEDQNNKTLQTANLFDRPEQEPLLNAKEMDDLRKGREEVIPHGSSLPGKSFEDQVADKLEHEMDDILDKYKEEPTQVEKPAGPFDDIEDREKRER